MYSRCSGRDQFHSSAHEWKGCESGGKGVRGALPGGGPGGARGLSAAAGPCRGVSGPRQSGAEQVAGCTRGTKGSPLRPHLAPQKRRTQCAPHSARTGGRTRGRTWSHADEPRARKRNAQSARRCPPHVLPPSQPMRPLLATSLSVEPMKRSPSSRDRHLHIGTYVRSTDLYTSHKAELFLPNCTPDHRYTASRAGIDRATVRGFQCRHVRGHCVGLAAVCSARTSGSDHQQDAMALRMQATMIASCSSGRKDIKCQGPVVKAVNLGCGGCAKILAKNVSKYKCRALG